MSNCGTSVARKRRMSAERIELKDDTDKNEETNIPASHSGKIQKTSPPTYPASGLKFSLHGTFYQLQLLMLYMHRALEKYPHFDLATEMDQADKFDDIVFRYKNSRDDKWHWTFLQAKHKQNPDRDKITIKDLFSDSEGNFSFSKYFLSFCKIKANPIFADSYFENFVLCTNTDIDFSLKGSKRDKDGRSVPNSVKKVNELVKKWKKLIVRNSLPDSSILFCQHRSFKAIVNSFSEDAYEDLSSVVKPHFLELCQGFNIIDDQGLKHIADKIATINILSQKDSVENARKVVDELNVPVKKKEPGKGNYQAAAKCVLKFKGELLQDSDFEALKNALGEFNNNKSKTNAQSVTKKLHASIMCLLNKLLTTLKEANDKLLAYETKNTDKSKALNEDFRKLSTKKEEIEKLQANILNSYSIEELINKLQNIDHIPFTKKLKQIKINTSESDLEETKQIILEKLNQTISEIVIIGITFNDTSFRSYLEEFMKQFQVVTNYPDVDQLNRLIKIEFREKYLLLDADLLTNSFERNMTEWFMEYNNGRSTFLSGDKSRDGFDKSLQKQLNSLLASGFNKAYPEKLLAYNIKFADASDSIDAFLNSRDHQVLHIATLSTRLTSIKVLQKLNKLKPYRYQDSYICMRLRSMYKPGIRELVCEAFKPNSTFSLIIIECQVNTCKEPNFLDICDDLELNAENKQTIFISSLESDVVLKLLNDMAPIKIVDIKDVIRFQDLTEDSKKCILRKKVKLQNKTIHLKKMVDAHTANIVMDEKSLQVFIESNDTIQIGDTKAFSSIGYVAECYINRSLHPQKVNLNVFALKNSIFMITNITDDVLRGFGLTNIIFPWNSEEIPRSGIVLPPLEGNYMKAVEALQIKNPSINIIWLDYLQDHFVWKHCTDNFYEIEQCVDDAFIFQSYDCGTEEMFETPEPGRKVVLVANNPGAGKSTFVTSLSRKMKNANKDFWIVRINLNDHAFDENRLNEGDSRRSTRSLNEIPFVVDTCFAIEFISDIVTRSNPESKLSLFERELFKLGLSDHTNAVTPKIVLFFDGFDEISPTYKSNTIKLLNVLRETAVIQMWVTTRVHEKGFLQSELQSPSYLLNTLSKQDQILFLNNFWRESVIEKSHDLSTDPVRLKEYLQTIATRTGQEHEGETSTFSEIDRISELLVSDSTPNFQELQILMEKFNFKAFAEILVEKWDDAIRDYERAFVNLPLQLKMLGEIVWGKDFSLPDNIGLVNIYDDFLKYKLEIYFYEKNILVGNVGSDEVDERESRLLRNIHYLLAINELFPDLRRSDLEDLERINDFGGPVVLARVGLLVLTSEKRLKFIHRSFAEFLAAEYLVKTLQSDRVQRLLLEHVFLEDQYFLLQLLFDELLTEPYTHIVEFPEAGVTLIREICSQSHRDTFLHKLMLSGHMNIIKFYVDKLHDYPEVLDQLLFKPGVYGKCALHLVVYNPIRPYSDDFKMKIIVPFLKAIHNQDILVKLLTRRSEDMLILIHCNLPGPKSTNRHCRHFSVLQMALITLHNKAVLDFFIKHIKNKNLLMEICTQNGFNGDGTIFHFSVRSKAYTFPILLELLFKSDEENGCKSSQIEEIKEILLMKDSIGRTAFHWLALIKKSDYIIDFLNLVHLHLGDIVPFLESQDGKNFTPLDLALYTNNVAGITAILDSISKILPHQQFDDMLLQPTDECILYKAICQGKTDSAGVLLNWLHSYLSERGSSVAQVLLNSINLTDGRPCLSLAGARNFAETLKKVFDWFKETFSATDCNLILIDLLKYADCENDNTALHECVHWASTRAVRCLIDCITDNLNFDGQISLLFAVDKRGNTPFDKAPSEETKQILMDGYNLVFSTIRSGSNDISNLIDCFTPNIILSIEKHVNKYHNVGEEGDIINVLSKIKDSLGIVAWPPTDDGHLTGNNSVQGLLPI